MYDRLLSGDKVMDVYSQMMGSLVLPPLEEQLVAAKKRIEKLEQWDSEASTYVESVICMRTDFTGDPPYVGWKGLGLALNEALDERDLLRREVAALTDRLAEAQRRLKEAESEPFVPPIEHGSW
jgi:hypothetical protein